jgi:hypothetical protein
MAPRLPEALVTGCLPPDPGPAVLCQTASVLGVAQVLGQYAFVERLVGTMRREFLDHVLFWHAGDLERKLAHFQAYYNAARSHASLAGHTPLTFAGGHTIAGAELNHVRWVSHCPDLVQLPEAA